MRSSDMRTNPEHWGSYPKTTALLEYILARKDYLNQLRACFNGGANKKSTLSDMGKIIAHAKRRRGTQGESVTMIAACIYYRLEAGELDAEHIPPKTMKAKDVFETGMPTADSNDAILTVINDSASIHLLRAAYAKDPVNILPTMHTAFKKFYTIGCRGFSPDELRAMHKYLRQHLKQLSIEENPEVNEPPTPEESTMKVIKIETVTRINDHEARDMSDDQIFGLIADCETQIEELNKVKTTSTKLKAKTAALTKTAAELAAYVDNR